MREIIDALGSDDLLLYASDYPHQHTTIDAEFTPNSGPRSVVEKALGMPLPEELAAKIMAGNARGWYRNLAPSSVRSR